jgi:hypothetical protein
VVIYLLEALKAHLTINLLFFSKSLSKAFSSFAASITSWFSSIVHTSFVSILKSPLILASCTLVIAGVIGVRKTAKGGSQ